MESSSRKLDRDITLCLTCSSSLPPLRHGNIHFDIHITECCQRPICPSCISRNPRLARYNPCLSCLGGVDLVASGSRTSFSDQGFLSPTGKRVMLSGVSTPTRNVNVNINGAVRDEDTFILGDGDEEEEEEEEDEESDGLPPPPYASVPTISPTGTLTASGSDQLPTSESVLENASTSRQISTAADNDTDLPFISAAEKATPYKYYINRQDTLQGIALRFGLDVFDICKMNNLPQSIVRTTPHLLHTRTFLLLPSTARSDTSSCLSPTERARVEEKLSNERAEKKLQTLTKETDWRIAKAYVALADDEEEQEEPNLALKAKKLGEHENKDLLNQRLGNDGLARQALSLEAVALNKYLEDAEWEQAERRAGRNVSIPRFLLSSTQKSETKS